MPANLSLAELIEYTDWDRSKVPGTTSARRPAITPHLQLPARFLLTLYRGSVSFLQNADRRYSPGCPGFAVESESGS
jgi:hypothetical protein